MEKLYCKHTDNEFRAEMWNREYVFDGSPFPASVKISGKEILHAPIALKAKCGDVTVEWKDKRIVFIEENSDKAVFSTSMWGENVIINGNITLENDGFAKIDFSVMNFWEYCDGNAPRLTELCIDIPIRKEFAPLMHYWPYGDSAVCLETNVLNSHAVPKDGKVVGFKPFLWSGWEMGGLGICCEDPRSFEVDDIKKCMAFEDMGEYVNIHIQLLDHMPQSWQGRVALWGDNLMPINYTFGLQATPVKKFDTNHTTDWRVHQNNIDYYLENSKRLGKAKAVSDENSILEKLASMGVKWIILHERWSSVQNYGLPWDEEALRQFVKDCHSLGMKVMTYFGYEVSSLIPGFNQHSHEWLIKNTKGNFVGGWQRRPMQRAFSVCYNGSYGDILIERVKYIMDKFGVDGIYTDGTFVPWECSNEEHGCGWRDINGELHHTFPIFAVREFVKKLCHEIHKRGGVMDTHQSACLLTPTLGFADSYYDGENLQRMLMDNISDMRLDAFRCEYMGMNIGIPCNFIAYCDGDLTIRRMSGVTLLHNSFPRGRILEEIEFMSQVWKIFDKYKLSSSEWHPYWEQKEVKNGDKKQYCSYYETTDGIVIAAVNHNPDKNYMEFEFDRDYTEVCDLLNGGAVYGVENSRVKIPAKALDLQMYAVK